MATLTYRFRSAAHSGDVPRAAERRPYPLLRWFAVVSAVAILLVLLAVTSFLTRFVERTSLMHDAEALTLLIKSFVEVENAQGYFLGADGDNRGDFAEFLVHLARLPGVLRANVFANDHTVLWSSEHELIGKRFLRNEELDSAVAGEVVVKTGAIGAPGDKPEHTRLGAKGLRYVENYLPVWSPDPNQRRVIGVIEIYRAPVDLMSAIAASQQLIWWGAIGVAALLYGLLFVIVAHAAALMRRQQAALVAAEKLTVAGEMASAVAHGLRNPLASIRSTAELGIEIGASGETRDLLAEVVAQADRLESWIRQFLTTARMGPEAGAPAEVGATIQDCVEQFGPAFARRDIALTCDLPQHLPPVRLNPVLLRQVLNSILANAAEAVAEGGAVAIRAAAGWRCVNVDIADTGPGMSRAEVAAALSPFATTKAAGLGLGLPLARETLQRQGGRLVIASRPDIGTTVRLVLPRAAKRTADA